VKFRGKVVFVSLSQRKGNSFSIKLYKLCDSLGYTDDMNVYLGEQCKNAAGDVTATHSTVELVGRVENKGHKLYVNSYFSSPQLFYDLCNRKLCSCGTVQHNRNNMPANFGPKQLKFKKGDIVSKVHDNLKAICWKDESGTHAVKHTSSSSQ
jgi:hypothetical protein